MRTADLYFVIYLIGFLDNFTQDSRYKVVNNKKSKQLTHTINASRANVRFRDNTRAAIYTDEESQPVMSRIGHPPGVLYCFKYIGRSI